jgi:hypothetical protein
MDGMTLDKEDLIMLTSRLIHKELVLKPDNIKSAFQKTGIYPLSLSAPAEHLKPN